MNFCAKSLPLSPGCYLFKDDNDQVLYVGKSKCLRKRVSSYFKKQKDEKIAQMMHFAANLSHQETATDIEAMLLEHKLIRQYRPPYNVRMRKERQHWYMKVDDNYIYVIPKDERKKASCIGPFYRQDHAEEVLISLGDIWAVPTCQGIGKSPKKNSCLRFHIGQCLGPCIGNSAESAIQEVHTFLKGETEPVLQRFKNQIEDAAQAMLFEKAARLRDQRDILQDLASQIERMPPELEGKDYYIFLKSRHEDGFLLIYSHKRCVKSWLRFGNTNDSSAYELVKFEREEGLRLIDAILEVDAIRCFLPKD